MTITFCEMGGIPVNLTTYTKCKCFFALNVCQYSTEIVGLVILAKKSSCFLKAKIIRKIEYVIFTTVLKI